MPRVSDTFSTIEARNNDCRGERKLWAEVIQQAFYRASIGEGPALMFFKATDGMFSRLCSLMNLPEADIRQEVLQVAKARLQQKRIQEK